MVGFGGTVVNSLGSCVAKLKIQNVEALVLCVIVPDNLLKYSLLIGQSFSEQKHVRMVKTDKELLVLDIHDCQKVNIKRLELKVIDDISLSQTNLCRVHCGSDYDGSIYVRSSYRDQPYREYLIEEGVYALQKGEGVILISPLSNKPIRFNKNELIARADTILDSFELFQINRVECSEYIPFKLEQLNIGDIPDGDKIALLKLINQYRDCFAVNLKELGCTDIEHMTINLNNEEPVVYRPYRLSQKERQEVQEMVDELCESGVIRESNSPYASPIIVVKKKTGDKRLCVDYRLLNKKTIKQHYPLPHMEDQMNRLAGNKYYTTLDLASGYYQIPLSEDSKPKTAFVTTEGQWEFNRMPFGLANAPAIFQRTVNKALGPLRFNTAVAYMDDILVPSATVHDGLNKLEEILKKFREAKLTLKLSKCYFFKTSVDFLGLEVTSDGIRPGKKKTEAVENFPVPKDVHNIKQFIGLTSFFRKFIKDFAVIARPLTRLTKKNNPWIWGSEQQQSFDKLKSKLVSRPVLALYDPNFTTELHTDASKWGVGGILLQKQLNGDLKPVAYYSRQTSPEEQHFSAYDLETLAVVASLEKFRSYLRGMPFSIITDCNSLRATFLKRDMIPRVARWWSIIQEYDCDIVYKPGKSMNHVDALSRNPITSDFDDIEFPSVLNITSDWLKTVQLGDNEIKRIKEILLDSESSNVVEVKKNYVLKNGNIYRNTENGLKWLVPKGVRWQILKYCHDDIGHFSFDKTYEKVSTDYWFPKMRKFIKKYVQSCLQCAHSKIPSGKKSGYLHSIEKISIPFHTLHADHLGPFNQSKSKNKYILVIIDAFSKFISLKPVKSTKASTTIKVFREYFATFGLPMRLITDRYSTFTGKKIKDFFVNLGIKHIMNAVATPRANGQVERYNRTILDALTSMNHGRDETLWDEKVLDVQWGLNNTVNKGLGRTPTEVLFGKKLSGISDGLLKSVVDYPKEYDSTNLTALRDEVNEHIQKDQQRQSAQFNKSRCKPRTFNEGDLVRVERSVGCPGKSKKIVQKCYGPYRVVKKLENDRYLVQDTPITKRKGKATYTGIYPVERIHPWLNFKGFDDTDDNISDTSSDSIICDEDNERDIANTK